MFATLSAGAIGVQAPTLEETIRAAQVGGFPGTEFNVSEVASRLEASGVESVLSLFEGTGVKPAAFGVPTNWRSDEATWIASLKELPRLAAAAKAIGVHRTATWIMPADNEKNYDANWRFHVERFKPIAEIMGEHGISVGLEFVGPKTLRDQFRFPFVYTLGGMLALGREIGPNVGVLLDCWHWYTTEGTVAEIEAVDVSKIVYVHVNDGPIGKTVDEQLDGVRGLPGETGVVNIQGFLGALRTIGYDGPVTPEPFKKELADLPDDAARLKAVGAAMRSIGL